jgi:hypothetical protein
MSEMRETSHAFSDGSRGWLRSSNAERFQEKTRMPEEQQCRALPGENEDAKGGSLPGSLAEAW